MSLAEEERPVIIRSASLRAQREIEEGNRAKARRREGTKKKSKQIRMMWCLTTDVIWMNTCDWIKLSSGLGLKVVIEKPCERVNDLRTLFTRLDSVRLSKNKRYFLIIYYFLVARDQAKFIFYLGKKTFRTCRASNSEASALEADYFTSKPLLIY